MAPSPRQIRLLGSGLIGLCVGVVYYAASFLEPSGFLWEAAGIITLLIYAMWEAVAWVSGRLDARYPWARSVPQRLLRQVLYGAGLCLLIINGLYIPFKLYSITHYERPGGMASLGHVLLLTNGVALTLYCLVQAAQLGWQFMSRWRQAELRAERLQRESAQARLATLRTQISPHFLFNNLNVLSVLIDRDAALAKNFVEQFAQVYRYVLSSQERELVTLAEELEVVEAYVFLLRQRFAQGLEVEVNIPPALHPQLLPPLVLPPLVLQMLLENAIKHNVVSASRPLRVCIAADADGWLRVRNNVQPRSGEAPGTGLGLPNIRKRYEYLSEQTPEVLRDAATFTVRLPLLQLEPA